MHSKLVDNSGESRQRHAAWLLTGDEKYGVGGPVLTLARQLRTRDWQTHMFLLTDGAFAELCRGEGIATTILNAQSPRLDRHSRLIHLPGYFLRQLTFSRTVARRLAAGLQEIDAEHLGVRWPVHVAAAGIAAQLADVPCYWMMPSIVSGRWPFQLDRRWYRHLCRSRGITPLANSQYTAETLGGDIGQRVLYLAADDGRFSPDAAGSISRSEIGIPEHSIAVGIFARLDPDKGHSVVWQAMIEEISEGSNLELLVVGGPVDGEVAANLRRSAGEKLQRDRLHLAGWTDAPERFYDAIDFAISAYLGAEGFGLSVVEAMMSGKPVLVHARGGPAETVIDGVTGWHVSEPTVAGFRAGLKRALADRPRWEEMGRAAALHARERFTSKCFATNFLRIVAPEP